jgi:uncharacterized Zn-finger protein
MTPFETIYIDSMIAACNGGGGVIGHPKVYLNLARDGQVECPYCSRLYVHRAKRGHHAVEGHGIETPAPGPGLHQARPGDHAPPAAPDPASPGVAPAQPANPGALSSSANLAKP